jgi:predicted 2-oxoglutarate/Fe(II)-dependent dioxygenase YbiX
MTQMVNGLFPGTLLPTSTVAGCIDIFENVWPNPEETITRVEEQCSSLGSGINWARAGTIQHGVNQNHRTNYNLGVTQLASETGNQTMLDIHNQMYLLLLASSIPYATKHDIENLFHEPYNMLKYSTGQEYKAHADGETITGRSVSAIVYLNEDYEGGEVEFVNYGIKIKPKTGMLLLFPSNYAYRHIAHPVTSGTKYALVTWIKDRFIQFGKPL